MAVTAGQVSPDGTAVTAAVVDFVDVPATGASLYVCYSATGPSGPFVASSSVLFDVVPSGKATFMTPNTALTDCLLPNVTINGFFCVDDPQPSVGFSTDSTCAEANVKAVSNVTMRSDGTQLTIPILDLSEFTAAASLYVCYSRNGSAPFKPSDDVLLTASLVQVSSALPQDERRGCTMPTLTLSGRMCPSSVGYFALSVNSSCASGILSSTLTPVAVSADGLVCLLCQRAGLSGHVAGYAPGTIFPSHARPQAFISSDTFLHYTLGRLRIQRPTLLCRRT
jgi:hypothetical protein